MPRRRMLEDWTMRDLRSGESRAGARLGANICRSSRVGERPRSGGSVAQIDRLGVTLARTARCPSARPRAMLPILPGQHCLRLALGTPSRLAWPLSDDGTARSAPTRCAVSRALLYAAQ